ncbi:hypothetical protein [Massilia yuzhufengensis]|uniref:Uncharacterized protein n=1 Tax=Massilia yuzhufengensis TaxID=1164594 RepID=A0A1I1QVB7_9BURK|nr:hypothetical protein [Massilia yuzhufengensis]SFD25947.1 hypothetical protein SAMN05216204_12044 [Massilia yuzhufengensis]
MHAATQKHPVMKYVLAIVAGFVVGSLVNMGLISLGGVLIPAPAGADVASMEGLQASMHLFEPKHFLAPFLAHALGTLVGALVAARLAPARHLYMAISVGLLFLAGGVASIAMLPSPLWFSALDLVFAYLPMAWFGWKLSGRPA